MEEILRYKIIIIDLEDEARELRKQRDELQALNSRMLIEYEQRMEQLTACRTEALSLRRALIGWRLRTWPCTDQAAIVNKEFPVTALKEILK